MLGVDRNALIQPRRDGKMAQTRVSQLVRDDWLDEVQIRLDGCEVAASGIDVHAAASGELTSLWIIVGDIPVVGIVIVKHDQDVVTPLWHMGNAIEDTHNPLKCGVDERDRGLGNVVLQCREKYGGTLLPQPILRPKSNSQVIEPGALAIRPSARLCWLAGDAIYPLLRSAPIKQG